ncbi:phage tail protein [Paraburkholderia sp. Ac-20342]|nr:phage tail protein [Paraburkholderia sp. Ac-20342]
MSVTAASATATLTADEIVIGSALGGLKYTLSSFSKTINLATTGAGGMDTGAAPASGYVALYAIYNPATGASALLATNATSAAAPNVYGGANMPGGYTASALVSVWPTSSSQFVVGTQRDRKIARSSVQVLSTTSTVTTTPLTVSSAIPPNAVACSGILEVTNGSSSTAPAISVYANAQSCGQQSIDVYETTGTTLNSPFNDLMVSVPSTIYYGTSTTSGTSTYAIRITAYSI